MACILGTGSNSCYDGKQIAYHVPSLAIVLGDEGVARISVAGSFRMLKFAPERISALFYDTYQINPDQIQEHVYKHPSQTDSCTFYAICSQQPHESAHEIVKKCFRNFCKKYQPVSYGCNPSNNFTGSIAYYFKRY
jgi:hypothetical protein